MEVVVLPCYTQVLGIGSFFKKKKKKEKADNIQAFLSEPFVLSVMGHKTVFPFVNGSKWGDKNCFQKEEKKKDIHETRCWTTNIRVKIEFYELLRSGTRGWTSYSRCTSMCVYHIMHGSVLQAQVLFSSISLP